MIKQQDGVGIMSDDNLKQLSVALAGRSYPVLITADEVAQVKVIEQTLNDSFNELKRHYGNQLNRQDLLAMLLLTYAKDLYEERKKNNLEPIAAKVDALQNILDQALQ